MKIPIIIVQQVMHDFWRAGVDKVSLGAFGMHHQRYPFEEHELADSIAATPGIKFDKGWIVECSDIGGLKYLAGGKE